jgi:hypothetical protein
VTNGVCVVVYIGVPAAVIRPGDHGALCCERVRNNKRE